MEKPFVLLVRFHLCVLGLGDFFIIDKGEPSTKEEGRVDSMGGLDQGHPDGLILIVFVLGEMPTVRDHCKNRRAYIHLPVVTWLPIVSQYANIIVLFFTGILIVPLVFLWQYYLEWSLDNTNLPRSR